MAWFNRVSPRYFEVMRTPILLGRDFNEHDTLSATSVAIVNEALVRRIFGNRNPIGQNRRSGKLPARRQTEHHHRRCQGREISHVAGAAVTRGPRLGFPSNLVPKIRDAMRALNPQIWLEFGLFETQVEDSLARDRLIAGLCGAFGVIALVLAAIGLYGVMAHMVARRTGEIGIRMALGAEPARVQWQVLREAMTLATVGHACGVAATLMVTHLVAALLYGLSPNDPATIISPVAIMGGIAAGSSLIPARRAAPLDPLEALRNE
jgi:hypothetical protein